MKQFTFVVPVQNISHPKMRLVPAVALPIFDRMGVQMVQSKLLFEQSAVQFIVRAPAGWQEAAAIDELQRAFDAATGPEN